jgi:serine/threonine protein kinase
VSTEASHGQGPTIERLGRYELLGEIASGGMATVFLGRVTGAKGFQRLVAIKRLHPHLESEEEFVSMFLDEARLAAKIRHPNVVGTLDVEDDEHLYIVMEYVEGDRLLAFLRHAAKSGEKIPPPVAVRIAMDTLAGLHAAHELCDDDGSPIGLVHRDVSPQNILVSVDGSVKLVDFGIAKASARLSVTRDGQLKGKIAYMAPEQTKRSEIDRRVDVFAMGIITWELLTAKKLFNGDSDVEVLNQLLFEPIPRLREVAPTVPASLDSVVARALERDPTKRFSTAAEFADALERASKIFGGPATTKTIAAHLQKVSGEKIAKDRARVLAGAPPVPEGGGTPSGVKRRATGQFSVPSFTNPGVTPAPAPPPPAQPPPLARKATMVGLGNPAAQPPVRPPPPVPRGPSPSFDAGPSLIDDDEDVPTSAIVRADVSKSLAAFLVKGPGASGASPMIAGDDLDEEPTAFNPVVPTAIDPSASGAATPPRANPGFNLQKAPLVEPAPGGTDANPSLFSPTANPRAMTQQLPVLRPGAPATVAAAAAAGIAIPPSTQGPAGIAPLAPIGPAGAPISVRPTQGAFAMDASFDAPEPRAEQPRPKTGLIVGVGLALMLLGGGVAAAYVKLREPSSPTIVQRDPSSGTATSGAASRVATDPAAGQLPIAPGAVVDAAAQGVAAEPPQAVAALNAVVDAATAEPSVVASADASVVAVQPVPTVEPPAPQGTLAPPDPTPHARRPHTRPSRPSNPRPSTQPSNPRPSGGEDLFGGTPY